MAINPYHLPTKSTKSAKKMKVMVVWDHTHHDRYMFPGGDTLT